MATRVIVSYDDTDNDRDALALGRVFADLGAEVSLAYVRHTHESDPRSERLQEHEAEALLQRGAAALGGTHQTHVVLSASTGEGLRRLAEREEADVVVFGSEYHTAPGHVQPGTSAERLLAGGPVAVAIAPCNFRAQGDFEIHNVGVIPAGGDLAASATARVLAHEAGARVADSLDEPIDFLVVGSRPEAPVHHAMVSAAAAYAIETARCPVLVVPRGVTLGFESPVLVAA
jgi:nucleotide-binding universal stress UspA family protein